MIYLTNTAQSQTLRLPLIRAVGDGALSLVLAPTMRGKKVTIVCSKLSTSDKYVEVSLEGFSAPAGEYEFSLVEGDVVLQRGVCKVVASKAAMEYNENKNFSVIYEQYGNK